MKSPLLLAIAVALLAVMSGDARQIEHPYWQAWYKLVAKQVPAPRTFAIVSLDNGEPLSAESVASSTARQAQLIDRLEKLGASHIYLDMPFAAGADPAGDQALGNAIARAPGVLTLVLRSSGYAGDYTAEPDLPEPRFSAPANARLASSIWYVNGWMVGLKAPSLARLDGQVMPAVAVEAAAAPTGSRPIYPDYTVNPESVPVLDARGVLSDAIGPDAVKGKQVFVTATGGDRIKRLASFGHMVASPALLDISAAVSLSQGETATLSWFLFLAAFAIAVHFARKSRSKLVKAAVYVPMIGCVTVLPGLLRGHHIVAEIGSVMIACGVYVPLRLWEKWRLRVQQTSSTSGLPNIEALVTQGIPPGSDVVVACISHFEQMLATLPKELHGECSRQIARRISVASGGTIYDNADGHFVWLTQPCSIETLTMQLEGLKALFAAPLVIGDHVLDTNVHFGIDRNSTNKPISRIKAAIASSSEAESKLKLYEEFGSERMAEAPWELSLHARIDEALHNGDIWLAFQPQFDFRENRICGAEALIRWTDPERGTIPPDTFILQAERAGRIEAITYWVLERALIALERFNADHSPFEISVNLSARMVDQPNLVSRIVDIVDQAGARHGLLTFEVTETFNMTNHEVARENLAALRALGFRVSIDDFGTGFASLAYLSEIQTDEIKLDRRFVSALAAQARDKAISANIVKLAHSLGQTIVAEGVEDFETMALLRALECDRAQGYLIGRPVKLEDLLAELDSRGDERKEYG